MGYLAILFSIIVGVNVLLSLIILYVYLSNYRRARNPFTLSLILFAALLLFDNLLDLIFFSQLPDAFAGFIGWHDSVINVVQLIALLVLLRMTWK